ncbi:hypothetical protein KSP40_PGU005998 [Platanthera guangdongensis]|uniref:Secreted protein n=1 Tax=Platanthera guangdongensis TaxID=2320717 RepID=A0ABR2M184_9ASPA
MPLVCAAFFLLSLRGLFMRLLGLLFVRPAIFPHDFFSCLLRGGGWVRVSECGASGGGAFYVGGVCCAGVPGGGGFVWGVAALGPCRFRPNGALTLPDAPFQETWARSVAEDASPDYN